MKFRQYRKMNKCKCFEDFGSNFSKFFGGLTMLLIIIIVLILVLRYVIKICLI